MTDHTPPRALQRVGIRRATSNIPEGHQLQAPAKTFALLFRKELLRAFTDMADTDDRTGHKR